MLYEKIHSVSIYLYVDGYSVGSESKLKAIGTINQERITSNVGTFLLNISILFVSVYGRYNHLTTFWT